MGSRGQRSASGKSSITVMSLEEYLGMQGLNDPFSDYTLDKWKIPHGETQRQYDRRMRETTKAANEFYEKKNKARQEYKKLVEEGKVRAPTNVEKLLKEATGLAEKESVQAARRALKKRGYDWKTGKKLK